MRSPKAIRGAATLRVAIQIERPSPMTIDRPPSPTIIQMVWRDWRSSAATVASFCASILWLKVCSSSA